MDYNDIMLYGGSTLGALGIPKAYEYIHDINKINKWSNMGYGKGNPVSPDMLNTLKGSWVPNTTFEKLGYGPGSTKQWFFSRSSPRHFGPVEKMMSWGRAGLPYLKQGAKFLKKAPGIGFVSDALFGTTYTADTARDINKLLGGGNQGGGNQGGGGYAAGQSASPTGTGQTGGFAGSGLTSAPPPKGPDLRNRARGGIASLWQR